MIGRGTDSPRLEIAEAFLNGVYLPHHLRRRQPGPPIQLGVSQVTRMSTPPLVLASLMLPHVLAGQSQGKHAITHEDVWLMPRVGAPVPSPDGRWVVFEVTEPAYDDSMKVEDLWIVEADGSGLPRRLTIGKGSESEPAGY
jgi:hypothetical protein